MHRPKRGAFGRTFSHFAFIYALENAGFFGIVVACSPHEFFTSHMSLLCGFRQLQLTLSTTTRLSNGDALSGAKSLALGDAHTLLLTPFLFHILAAYSNTRQRLSSVSAEPAIFPFFTNLYFHYVASVWWMHGV